MLHSREFEWQGWEEEEHKAEEHEEKEHWDKKEWDKKDWHGLKERIEAARESGGITHEQWKIRLYVASSQ